MTRIASFASAFAFNGFAVGESSGEPTFSDSAVTVAALSDSAVTVAALSDSAVAVATVSDSEAI